MLTEVKAYSSWPSAPTLLLSEAGRAETDLIQIRNIDGLDPVKASVNTSPYGSTDGAALTGTSVVSRNIVLTLHPNPDWDNWTHAELRRLIYSYFMPKSKIRLVFTDDEIAPVEIQGYVEEASVNNFSPDPEFKVSVICPDPYFVSVDPIVVTGQSVREGGTTTPIVYNGNVPTGIYVKVLHSIVPEPLLIGIQIGDPDMSYFTVDVDALISATQYFEMSSVPMQKYVEFVDLDSGIITNLLSEVGEGSSWPMSLPGTNQFSVITDDGTQDWELRYYERYGGL